MTFSSRAIGSVPPPASRAVRKLIFALWMLPIAISACVMTLARQQGAMEAKAASVFPIRVASSAAVSPVVAIGEPETFRSVARSRFVYHALNLPRSDAHKFSLDLAAPMMRFAADAAPSVKALNKVVEAPSVVFPARPARVTSAPVRVSSYAPNAETQDDPQVEPALRTMPAGVRVFRKAIVLGANIIKADGLTIELAGITPPSSRRPANASMA